MNLERILRKTNRNEVKRLSRPSFEVIGERCSGTNMLTVLLRENLGLEMTETYGWKHGFPTLISAFPNTAYVVLVRNVFDWLKSMYGKPWHSTPDIQALPFSDFLRVEWSTTVDHPRHFKLDAEDPRVGEVLQWDRHPLEGRAFRNILELRSVKLRAHLALRNREVGARIYRYEDVIETPARPVADVARLLELPAPSFVQLPQGKHGDHLGDWTHRKEHLARFPAKFTEDDQAFVLEQLDLCLEHDAGYDYEASKQTQ